MSVRQAYNSWASQYDTNENKTRDLEGRALQSTLMTIGFNSCLEIGCGTGKNTHWLSQKAEQVTAVDLSEQMLAKAKEKTFHGNVEFRQADITRPWAFGEKLYDLVTFSLVLEHIEHLDQVLREASGALLPGGHVYIGELHPFKQYTGSKARFESEKGLQIVECYNHHITDFTEAAKVNGFILVDIGEHFDDPERTEIPRILTLLFKKPD